MSLTLLLVLSAYSTLDSMSPFPLAGPPCFPLGETVGSSSIVIPCPTRPLRPSSRLAPSFVASCPLKLTSHRTSGSAPVRTSHPVLLPRSASCLASPFGAFCPFGPTSCGTPGSAFSPVYFTSLLRTAYGLASSSSQVFASLSIISY